MNKLKLALASVPAALLGFVVTAHADIVTLPSAASTTAAVETQSGTWFTEFILIALVGLGIVIGGMVVGFLVGKVSAAAKTALGRKRGGRGRRRR